VIDRKLLIILVLLSIYVFWGKPMQSKLSDKTFELRQTERLLAKEIFIQKKSKEIEKIYPAEIKKIEENKRLFFSDKISTSSAMSLMQKRLKRNAKISGVDIVNLNWGTPEYKKGYTSLPISLTIVGYPSQIFSFVRYTVFSDKLFRFLICNTFKRKDKIGVNMIVLGFKLGK